jgi:hypothetical protein
MANGGITVSNGLARHMLCLPAIITPPLLPVAPVVPVVGAWCGGRCVAEANAIVPTSFVDGCIDSGDSRTSPTIAVHATLSLSTLHSFHRHRHATPSPSAVFTVRTVCALRLLYFPSPPFALPHHGVVLNDVQRVVVKDANTVALLQTVDVMAIEYTVWRACLALVQGV